MPSNDSNEPSDGDTQWVLEVTSGVHEGARITVAHNDILAIGSGSDCEVVLADDGVAEHHGMLIHQAGQLWLRAVDAPLTEGNRPLAPGGPRRLLPDTPVAVGAAIFTITHSVGSIPRQSRRFGRTARDRRARLGAAAVVILAASWPLVGQGPLGDARDGNQTALDAALIAGLDALPTLSQDSVEARPGDEVAEDVDTVLRLSGIAAEVTPMEEGRVEVKGYLGDHETLSKVIHSRAMRAIRGLREVVAVNFDAGQPPPASVPKPPPVPEFDTGETNRVIDVVDAGARYIETKDGSRYGLGSRLPNGYRLAGIMAGAQGQRILIDNGTETRRLGGVGTVLRNNPTPQGGQ